MKPASHSTFGIASAALALLLTAWTARAEEWGPIQVLGKPVAPGETVRVFADVSGALGGKNRTLDTLVVVTRGVRPGPTLCLVAGVHGDEINGLEIAHRIYAETKGADLAGTLIAAPAVNTQGIRSGSRYLPDRRDLNRAFPGSPNGSLAGRIAHSLHQGVIRHCALLIDLHTGSNSRTNLPQIRTDLKEPRALALARSFGVGVVLNGRGPKGSLRRSLLDAGLPAVIYEAGEPLRFNEEEIALGVEGVRNVMFDQHMLKGQPTRGKSEVYRKTAWIRSGDALGVFLTRRKPGEVVKKGDALGTVTDPVTEEKATITAPRDGRIIGMAVPQLVLPGYGLFHLGFDPE